MTISPRAIQNSIVVVVIIFFYLCLHWGWRAGQDIARTRFTVRTAYVTLQGLDYFYNDQSRYPSENEFVDRNRMGVYISNFPPTFLTHNLCPVNGQYATQGLRTFSLQFCTPRSLSPFQKGVSAVSEKTFIPAKLP